MLKADFTRYVLRFHSPVGTSRGVLTDKPSWIIHLYDPEQKDITGTGECSLIPYLSPDQTDNYTETLAAVSLDPEYFLISDCRALEAFPSIRTGLEMAFADYSNGGNGIYFPSGFIHQSYGIAINGLIWMGTKADMIRQVRKKIGEGYKCIKLKIGALDFSEELKLLKAIRREFGTDITELRVDANGAFSPLLAMEKIKQLSDYDLHSIEQPIKPGQWEAMSSLCQQSPVPIAVDEELFVHRLSEEDRIRLLDLVRPHYIVLKTSMLGGFDATNKWIELARERSIGFWITSALESNIGLNALAQYTCSINHPVVHGLGTGSLFSNNFTSHLYVENGFLRYRSFKA